MEKNSRKLILLISVFCFFFSEIYGQGVYIGIHSGYAITTSKESIVKDIFGLDFPIVAQGEGFQAGLSGGYMFSSRIGAEVEVSYFRGAPFSHIANNHEKTVYSNMVYLIPGIVITPGFEKVNPYGKFGMLIGTGSIFFKEKHLAVDYVSKFQMKGGLALGIQARVGVSIKVSNTWTVFCELSSLYTSYAPTMGEFIESRSNGEDNLPSMDIRNKQFEFRNIIKLPLSLEPGPASEPTQTLMRHYPLGNIGLRLGIKVDI